MNDASRVTWSGVFLTMACTLTVGVIIREARWESSDGYGQHPQVLWTLGFLALGFFLVSAQLRLPIWLRARRETQAERVKKDAGGTYWQGE